ncbi:fucolectin-1-like, partial [Patella vulgata]|uniref:fucolectin-1-like n=1 Tax=Patella vulgata TaxID=6465 RepID=UPI0024A87D48
DPWWQVDLQNTYNITSVTISNRVDDKQDVGHRLSDTSIIVYETTPSPSTAFTVCKFIPGIFGCTIRTFECDGVAIGRWVRITKPTDVLTLCEVEVRGTMI